MVTENQLRWTNYGGYQGYYYFGKHKYVLPENATDQDKYFSVAIATEGGCSDSFNGYDSCGCSLGRYQLTELCSGWLVSDLLGAVKLGAPMALASLEALQQSRGYALKRLGGSGPWRWHQGSVPVDHTTARRIYGLNSDGRTWTDADKSWARLWVTQLINVWEDPKARAVQDMFLTGHLMGFILPKAKWLFEEDPALDTKYGHAARAAFLSFVLNNPSAAASQLTMAAKDGLTPGTAEWLDNLLKRMTLGPNIPIYMERMKKILPLLVSYWDVGTPSWMSPPRDMDTAQEIQEELIAEGYDCGPAGADGKMGPKTSDAILKFQVDHSLACTGSMNESVRSMLLQLRSDRIGKSDDPTGSLAGGIHVVDG